LKTLRMGKAKLVIIANNTPPLRKSEIECCSVLLARQHSLSTWLVNWREG